jgi:DNA invertase Pin-like site-specific DNA recombinase
MLPRRSERPGAGTRKLVLMQTNPTEQAQAKRAAGYVRVSTARQAEQGLSIDQQEAQVAAYIEQHGWELAGVYVERGISGRRASRPELDRLLATLGEIDYLVIPKLDRLGRSVRNILELVKQLEDSEVALVSIADNFDSTGFGKFQLTLLSALAELESATTGERVKSVMAGRAADGKHHARSPYGFGKCDKRLVPVEPDSSIVRRIFQETADGQTQRAIVGRLNAEKVKRPNGAPWTPSNIHKILNNVAYIGKVEAGGEVYEGEHEAIIDSETWEAVRKLKDANKAAAGGGRGRLPHLHLFVRGHLRCALCDAAMLPRTNARNGYTYYQCATRKDSGIAACGMENVPRLPVDQAVFNYFARVGIDLEATRAKLLESVNAKQLVTKQLLKVAVQAGKDATAAVDRVREDYMAGSLSVEEWKELRGELNAKQEQAQERVSALEDQAAAAAGEGAQIRNAEDLALARLAEVRAAVAGQIDDASDIAAARAGIRRLFDSFYIAPAAQRPVRSSRSSMVRHSPLIVDEWMLTPEPRLEVVEDLEVAFRPVLKQEPLPPKANNGAPSVVADTVQFLDGPGDRPGAGGGEDPDAHELVGVGAGDAEESVF